MNREQAAEIQGHLLEADGAMARARRAVAELAKEDRETFDRLLAEIAAALQSEVLAVIYQRHPDLAPPAEAKQEPFIDSELRWDQVRLPRSITEADIDAAILSVMKPQWRKVAMIVAKASERCRQLGLAISDEALAARIQVLAEAGRIEDVGDIRLKD
jgi:hypothetical protein